MSLALLFLYLMLNMFRMLIHPSSGVCDLIVELFHGLYCSGSMCVGVSLWFGCGGVVSVCRLKPAYGYHIAGLLKLWFRIPPGAWMSVCCQGCVLSGRGLYDGLITCPEESYRPWCVVVCHLETSWMRRPWPTGDCCAKLKKNPATMMK